MRNNPFDEALSGYDDEGLNGIGSSIRKIGRKIDHVARKIRDNTPILNKVHAELKRFLKTDIGKVFAVVVAVVAAVYLGPAALELLKVVVAKAGAFVKLAAKKAAEYVAKQGAKKLIMKEVKSKAISYVAEKAGKKYAEHKIRGQEKEAARELAIYEKEYEDKVFREMEAEFLKQSGQTLDAVESEQFKTRQARIPKGPTNKIIPTGFAFSKREPHLYDFWRGGSGRSGPPSNIIKELEAAKKQWGYEYDKARSAYMEAHPAINPTQMQTVLSSIDALSDNIKSVEASPAFVGVKQSLTSQGVPPKQIQNMWRDSATYKEVTRNSIVLSMAPMVKEDMIKRGASEQEAEFISIGAAIQVGDKAAKSANPLLLIGGLAALFLFI